ncbi:LAFA_0E07822g1_1 [Lachancea sp. 'fantastica']|nr:LAFA_0E07822g1_1 [Lachancea sp. 'fantastica']
MSSSTLSGDDEILRMFFDEQFVSFGYIDLLLSPDEQIGGLQSISSTLLSRLDLYTDRLTTQLESKIRKLRKPTELLTYTNANTEVERTTKLQYYLDTLSNSVKDLKDGIAKVETELEDQNPKGSTDNAKSVQALQDLNLVKNRLIKVSVCLADLRAIVIASFEGIGEDEIPQTVTLADFEDSLNVLGDILCADFKRCLTEETPASRNVALLDKVLKYEELRNAFKCLAKFGSAYDVFVDRIRAEAEQYLQKKNIDSTFL